MHCGSEIDAATLVAEAYLFKNDRGVVKEYVDFAKKVRVLLMKDLKGFEETYKLPEIKYVTVNPWGCGWEYWRL